MNSPKGRKPTIPLDGAYRGLVSLTDPFWFDHYLWEIEGYVEIYFQKYFECLIVAKESSRKAYEAFLRAIAEHPAPHTVELWLNLLSRSIQRQRRYIVVGQSSDDHAQHDNFQILKKYPSSVIAVCVCVAIVRAEFGIRMQDCIISMNELFELAELLATSRSLWMFDQAHLLGPCGRLVTNPAT